MLIANRIKSYRLKHEYTQDYIAKQLEVSRVTVSNWEKGRTIPDVYNLMKLSDFYNVSIVFVNLKVVQTSANIS